MSSKIRGWSRTSQPKAKAKANSGMTKLRSSLTGQPVANLEMENPHAGLPRQLEIPIQ